jgi:hypothetical protein
MSLRDSGGDGITRLKPRRPASAVRSRRSSQRLTKPRTTRPQSAHTRANDDDFAAQTTRTTERAFDVEFTSLKTRFIEGGGATSAVRPCSAMVRFERTAAEQSKAWTFRTNEDLLAGLREHNRQLTEHLQRARVERHDEVASVVS